jgi:hypothetical protein
MSRSLEVRAQWRSEHDLAGRPPRHCRRRFRSSIRKRRAGCSRNQRHRTTPDVTSGTGEERKPDQTTRDDGRHCTSRTHRLGVKRSGAQISPARHAKRRSGGCIPQRRRCPLSKDPEFRSTTAGLATVSDGAPAARSRLPADGVLRGATPGDLVDQAAPGEIERFRKGGVAGLGHRLEVIAQPAFELSRGRSLDAGPPPGAEQLRRRALNPRGDTLEKF